MGCGASNPASADKNATPREIADAKERNNEIDKELNKETRVRKVKLLLLGTADSGKSTVLKQMKIINGLGFSEEEIDNLRRIVYSNIVESTSTMLHAMNHLGINLTDSENQVHADLILDLSDRGFESEPSTKQQVYDAVQELWKDKAMLEVYQRRSEYQLNESIKYFIGQVERLRQDDYKPNEQDILFMRIPTNGVAEVRFSMARPDGRGSIIFRVFDVGGQRSERRKWIHVFDDVNAIIFVTAIGEYDQRIQEDDLTNRMVESTTLFASICNSKWFLNTSMILFLNKKDVFAEKVKRVPITVAFPEYDGPQTYESSVEFIENVFVEMNTNPKKNIFVYQTCATDTNQVQLVMDSVNVTILEQTLESTGVI